MPYITPSQRVSIKAGIAPKTPGELNYALTMILDKFILDHGLSYNTVNDVVGALECCKLEAYRRVVGPMEDFKIQANGDVYHMDSYS